MSKKQNEELHTHTHTHTHTRPVNASIAADEEEGGAAHPETTPDRNSQKVRAPVHLQ